MLRGLAAARALRRCARPAATLPARWMATEAQHMMTDGEILPAMATRTTWKGVTRFYDKVDIVETDIPIVAGGSDASAAAAAGAKKPGNFWQVTIQGRTLRTNGMNELLIPSRPLALAIATEFASQGRVILPTSQPLYNMTCSAIDNFATENAEEAEEAEADARAQRLAAFDEAFTARGIGTVGADMLLQSADPATAALAAGGGPAHANTAATGRADSGALSYTTGVMSTGTGKLRDLLLDHLETDTVCYRIDPDMADPSERTLLKRQERYYGPLLQWWEEGFGHKLGTAAGFGDVVHPDEAYIAAEDAVDSAHPFAKAALSSLISSTRSTVITLALAHRAITVDEAFNACRVEEEWQIDENGFVEDGHDTARAQTRTTLAAASALLWMVPEAAPTPLPVPGKKLYAEALATAAAARHARVMARRQREQGLVAAKRQRLREAALRAVKERAQ